MSETMWLILHKVDGKPAFDVACKLEITEQNGDEMWIIPTSGHRAYPYHTWKLEDLSPMIAIWKDEIPAEWPEHYQNAREHHEPSERMTFNIGALLNGLIPKVHRKF
jgi:hypothetical protein